MNGRPHTILLVEDNPDHAELVRRNLECLPASPRIIHVTDGEQALAHLRGQGEYADAARAPRPGLVLLDLRLPRLDGFAVLKEMKGDPALRAIPVVILSTSTADSDRAAAAALHADGYLAKPVGHAVFSELLARFGF